MRVTWLVEPWAVVEATAAEVTWAPAVEVTWAPAVEVTWAPAVEITWAPAVEVTQCCSATTGSFYPLEAMVMSGGHYHLHCLDECALWTDLHGILGIVVLGSTMPTAPPSLHEEIIRSKITILVIPCAFFRQGVNNLIMRFCWVIISFFLFSWTVSLIFCWGQVLLCIRRGEVPVIFERRTYCLMRRIAADNK